MAPIPASASGAAPALEPSNIPVFPFFIIYILFFVVYTFCAIALGVFAAEKGRELSEAENNAKNVSTYLRQNDMWIIPRFSMCRCKLELLWNEYDVFGEGAEKKALVEVVGNVNSESFSIRNCNKAFLIGKDALGECPKVKAEAEEVHE